MRRVFIVDDEKIIADTLSAILRNHGYDAEAFYDGESALAASEAQSPEFVISDVVMPGMSGIELGTRIRRSFPNCGVLLFSGQAATADLLGAVHMNGRNFELLTKPVHPTDLLAKLENGFRTRPQFTAC